MNDKTKPEPAHDNPRLYRNPRADRETIRVDLGDGRMAVVGADWRGLPLDFHNEAVRQGCEVDTQTGRYSASDAPDPKQGAAAPSAGSDEAVRARVLEMLQRDEEGDFVEATGKPNLRVLTGLCGFTVDQSQASRVLKGLEEEARQQALEEQQVADAAAAAQAEAATADPDAAAAAAAAKVAERKKNAQKAIKKVAAKKAPAKTAASA